MLTPQEVSGRAFSKAAFGGYNMAMVDEFLDELTDDYTSLYKENAALKAKLKVLVDKVEEYRSTEEAMRKALLTAQKMADELVAQAEAKKKAAEEMRRIQMERKLNKSIATASREGIRAYARGRLYDPERYPTFPYQDPNDLAKQAQEEQQRLAEEQKTAKAKGKKGKKDQPNQPTKTEKPAQAAQEEKPSAAPTSAAPEKPVPQPRPSRRKRRASWRNPSWKSRNRTTTRNKERRA